MIDGLSDEENITAMQEILGVDEMTARFILAVEKGERVGDVVEIQSEESES